MRRSATLSLAAGLVLMLGGCGHATAPKKRADPPPPQAVTGFTLRQIATLPVPSEGLAAAAWNGVVTIFGGLGPQGSLTAIYRLENGKLTHAGQLPLPIHDLAAAPLQNGSLLVAGGGQVQSFDRVYRYRAGQVESLGVLPTPRSDLAAVPLQGSIYLIGGFTGSTFLRSILRVDGRGHVATAGELPLGLRYVGAAPLGTSIYLFGGLAVQGYQSAIYRFIPGQGVARVGALPVAVRAPLVAAGQGGILVVGGESAPGQDQAGVYWYTPRGGLKPIGRLPAPLALGAAVYLGHDRFALIGGEDGSQLAQGVFLLSLKRRP